MQFKPNQRFQEFLLFLKKRIAEKPILPSTATAEYRTFISKFPANKLAQISLEEYCVGKGNQDNFCWWMERGLEKILGRYMPGTSRGHIVYFGKDGQVEKNKQLKSLSDDEALRYTLTMQAAIANTSLQDAKWIDDDNEIYQRTKLAHLGTIGEGRKLRLLTAYHPDELLPLSSSAHVGHFLEEFGCDKEKVPAIKQPIARLLMLNDLFVEAKKHIPTLSPNAMMWAMYDREFGASPLQDQVEEMKTSDSGQNGDIAPDVEPEVAEDLTEFEQSIALNQILAGPPGTGKTYATIDLALKITDPDFYSNNWQDRAALKGRFDELVSKQIHFTTFHQSFSYEDFVEGLRANTDAATGQISYKVEPGIFQQVCNLARARSETPANLGLNENPSIWKISIDGAGDNATRRYCFAHDEARIGWGDTGDLRNVSVDSINPETGGPSLGSNERGVLSNFSKDIRVGDVLLCLSSVTTICAVGVVRGGYSFNETPPAEIRQDYCHVLKVDWILSDIHFSILELNENVQLTLKTVYKLSRIQWNDLSIALQKAGHELPHQQVQKTKAEVPYVLIIDEINRGNISRIFGELITLIEASKRDGMPEALEVTLPYSKRSFSVPSNVFLIGTMNTADRSLTGLDIALRRRFEFIEMPAQPKKLANITIAGIALEPMLEAINQRIEVLLGRDYCIGHAYFIQLKSGSDIAPLAQIMRNKITPLLQEYFFEDWQRIAWVFNDQNKESDQPFVRQKNQDIQQLFGGSDDIVTPNLPWEINPDAFHNINSYMRIYAPKK